VLDAQKRDYLVDARHRRLILESDAVVPWESRDGLTRRATWRSHRAQ
jgi:hypothetical protein